MASANVWDGETGIDLSGFTAPNDVAGSSADILVSSVYNLSGVEEEHDSLECTLSINGLTPNDEVGPVAPQYGLSFIAETRVGTVGPWTMLNWTEDRILTPGQQHTLQSAPDASADPPTSTVAPGGQTRGSRTLRPGYLQKYFRFRIECTLKESAANPGMLTALDVDLSFSTYKRGN